MLEKILMEDFCDGTFEAKLFTLKNSENLVQITNYGATIVKLMMKDVHGERADVLLGFDDLKGYLIDKGKIYYGASVGRNANRIKHGQFTLNGVDYQLAINNGPNHLHGGIDNFSSKLFDYTIEGDCLKLSYHSKDMEEGYPGNLDLCITYQLVGNQLIMSYDALSDADTICNITNHSYYNLKGEGQGSIEDHQLKISADEFVECDADGLGNVIASVEGTPFDFREFHAIGERMNEENQQLKNGHGYDHHFIFKNDHDQVVLYEPLSQRKITFSSTQKGVQIYTANWFDQEHGKGHSIYDAQSGVAIEFQNIPDGINRVGQPTLLKANEVYHEVTTMTFEIGEKNENN